jgi:hypothetical protein
VSTRGSIVVVLALVAAFAVGARHAAAQSRGRVSPAHRSVDDAGPAAAQPLVALTVDGGAVPAPPSDESQDGGKLSPLNPAPNEASDAGPLANSAEYDGLLADIAALRARVAAVSDTLFHSRIEVDLETSGDHGRVAALAISLDDGIVWTSPPSFRASDPTAIYEHAAAPGHHALTVDIERRDDRNDAFRSAQRTRLVVDVPVDQKLRVELHLWDDSNIGADFPTGRRGEYELRVRARVSAVPLGK